jgi:hypothetical protein
MGFEPKREEVRRMIAESDREGSGTISFDTFKAVMASKMHTRDPKEESIKAFRLFDDDETGTISLKNLRRVAKELGENMTDDELQVTLLAACTPPCRSAMPRKPRPTPARLPLYAWSSTATHRGGSLACSDGRTRPPRLIHLPAACIHSLRRSSTSATRMGVARSYWRTSAPYCSRHRRSSRGMPTPPPPAPAAHRPRSRTPPSSACFSCRQGCVHCAAAALWVTRRRTDPSSMYEVTCLGRPALISPRRYTPLRGVIACMSLLCCSRLSCVVRLSEVLAVSAV